MTLQQAAGYQNRKDIPPQQVAGNYQVKKGANVIQGQVTFKGIADAFGMKLASVDKLL
jgi:alanine dehydrogenase